MLKKKLWVFVFLIFTSGMAYSEGINWQSYETGMKISRQYGKKVFLHFKTDWCGYCKKMDYFTFSDKNIISFLNQHFVAIRVDGDSEIQVKEAYGVKGFPDSRFLDGRQEQVHRLPGFVRPDTFMVFLEYIQSDSYKKMNPMEYYKSR